MFETAFIELGIVILIAVIISGIMKFLRQPLIIGYIITGLLISFFFTEALDFQDSIATFAKVGVALLLFMVGLHLNPKSIKDVGKVSLFTGIGQVTLTTTIGFIICQLMGFSLVESFYIAISLAFSSTIIIMKLLSDKGDVEALYGKISIGFLIVQDLIVVFLLMIISSTAGAVGSNFVGLMVESILIGIAVIAIIMIFGIYVLPKLIKNAAKSQEFLLLFSIGWCIALGALFHYLGYSLETGALIAGVVLSMSPYRYEISSKMKPLRDFFIVLFFILLGSQMIIENLAQMLPLAIILSVVVLIGNPIIVMTIMGLMGYTKRNGFLAGLTVAQISEFSIILVTLGISVGHVGTEVLSLVTIIALITIAGSTYFILYSNKIYPVISKYLSIFERKKGNKKDIHRYHDDKGHDIVLIGYNRTGYDLMESFKRIKQKFLVVDYNPDVILKLAKEGIDCLYGDASDLETLNEINFEKAKMIVSTIGDIETDILLIQKIRERNKKVIIIVVSHQIEESIRLYEEGANYVILPHFIGGHHTATMIEEFGFNIKKFLEEKVRHVEHLKKRNNLGKDYPGNIHKKNH
ncbi:MAG: cation:proton antiporter [Candidatus Woesearchaeota archaeon]